MTRSTHNDQIVQRLRGAVDSFTREDLDLDGVQAALQSALSLVERDGTATAEVIRQAEADVEEVRFTRLRDEQRPAVVFRLDRMLEELE